MCSAPKSYASHKSKFARKRDSLWPQQNYEEVIPSLYHPPLSNQCKPLWRNQILWRIRVNAFSHRGHEAFGHPPEALPVTQARRGSTGRAESFHILPVMLRATLRLKFRKTGWWQKMERNLFGDQESFIWWKTQTRARLRNQEARCWGIKE